MYLALFQRVQRVSGADHLIAQLLDLGCAHHEILVCLEVHDVVEVEVRALGVVLVCAVGCLVGTCAHGNLGDLAGTDGVCHKVKRAVVHAELVVRNIHGISLCVVVLGSYREGEVPDRLGVHAVDGDLQHVVFAAVCGRAVCVVLMRYGVGAVVCLYLVDVGGVTERDDARNVGNEQRAVLRHVLTQDHGSSLCRIFGQQGRSGCPVLQNDVQLLLDLLVVHVLNRRLLGGNDVGGVGTGDLFDLGLDVLIGHGVFFVFHVDKALGKHERGNLVKFTCFLVRGLGVSGGGGHVVVLQLLAKFL